MAWLSLPRALLSPKVLLLLLSLSERAALRATLLEILEEYLLLCFEEEESSYCVAASPFHGAPADLFIYYAFRWWT